MTPGWYNDQGQLHAFDGVTPLTGIWLTDVNNNRQALKATAPEQRTLWRNLWMAVRGIDPLPLSADIPARRDISFDSWPDYPGCYERATAALASIRASV